MLESKFQAGLKTELKKMFPGCIITKLDANYSQGLPDRLFFIKTNGLLWRIKKAMTRRKDESGILC